MESNYTSFGCIRDSYSSDDEQVTSKTLDSSTLNKTISTLSEEIALKVNSISKNRSTNSPMLTTSDNDHDFEQEVSSVNKNTDSGPRKNNVLLLPELETSPSTVTFVNLDKGEGFSASMTRDSSEIIATTVDEQTFNNLFDQISAESPRSSFLSTSIIAKPNKNGNIDIFLLPKNAAPRNETPKKVTTTYKLRTPTRPLKRKLSAGKSSKINAISRQLSYSRDVIGCDVDDGDQQSSDATADHEIDTAISAPCDQDVAGPSTRVDDEVTSESEVDNDSEDDLPLKSFSNNKRVRQSTPVRERRRRRREKNLKMNLISKNLMPTPPDKYVTEYVVAEKTNANGKTSKKEVRKLIWTTEPSTKKSSLIVKPANEPSKLSASDKCTANMLEEPLALFNEILTDDVCNKIVQHTNRYARKIEKQYEGNKRHVRWKETDVVEIRAFIGCLLFLGVHHKANLSLDKIFTTNWYELNLPTILSFARDRFKALMRYMRFSAKTGPQDNSEAENRLIKIQELFDPIIKNSRSLVTPGNVITVDEAVISFKGRCQFTQYLPNKPSKYGIKVWCACDAKTGYLLNGQIYSGKVGPSPEVNQGRRVVMDLLEPYFETDRIVVTDNFFTSIHLAEDLKVKSLGLVGTLRDGRPGVPKELYSVDLADEKKKKKPTKKRKNDSTSDSSDDESDKPLPKYKSTTGRPRKSAGKNHFDTRSAFLFTSDFTVLKSLVKPKRSVCLMSSIHHDPMISVDDQSKPEIILFYNQGKSGVDLLGQVIKNYSCKQTTQRWPYRIFTWLMDVAAYNTFVIYRSTKSDKEDMQNSRREFLTQLSIQLMQPLIQRRCKTDQSMRHISRVKSAVFAAMKIKLNYNSKEALDLLGIQDESEKSLPKPRRKPTSKNSDTSVQQKKAQCISNLKRCYYDSCRKLGRKTQYTCKKCARPTCRQHGNIYSTDDGDQIFICNADDQPDVLCREGIFAMETCQI